MPSGGSGKNLCLLSFLLNSQTRMLNKEMKIQTNNKTHMGMKGVVLGVVVACELAQTKQDSKMLVCLCVWKEQYFT